MVNMYSKIAIVKCYEEVISNKKNVSIKMNIDFIPKLIFVRITGICDVFIDSRYITSVRSSGGGYYLQCKPENIKYNLENNTIDIMFNIVNITGVYVKEVVAIS